MGTNNFEHILSNALLNIKSRLDHENSLEYYISKRLDKSLTLYSKELDLNITSVIGYKDKSILKRI